MTQYSSMKRQILLLGFLIKKKNKAYSTLLFKFEVNWMIRYFMSVGIKKD